MGKSEDEIGKALGADEWAMKWIISWIIHSHLFLELSKYQDNILTLSQ